MRKSYRIKKEMEFQTVFTTGEAIANRNFVIYHLTVPAQKHFRVGISVGKKVGHTAVLRNRIKRYIRQSLLELKPYLKQDVDFLVIARKSSRNLNFFETKKNLIHVLKLAGLLAKDFEPDESKA